MKTEGKVVDFRCSLTCRICCDMAELATSKREYDQAIKSYREALSYDRSHSKV